MFPLVNFAKNSTIHAVQNQVAVDLQLTNLKLSNYTILVDYLKNSYPSTLNTAGVGLGERMSLSKTFSQIYTQLMLSYAHTHLQHDGIAMNVFGDNYQISSVAMAALRGQWRLGYSFYPSEATALTPFMQLGYEYWQLDNGGVIPGAGNYTPLNGYRSTTRATVSSLGVLAQWEALPRWVLSLETSLGQARNAKLQFIAHVDQLPINRRELYFQQAKLNTSTVIETGLTSSYQFNELVQARLGINYLNILWGQGDAVAVGPTLLSQFVPHLRYSQWTALAGFGFSLDNPVSSKENKDKSLADPILRVNNQAFALLNYLYGNYAEYDPVGSPQLNGAPLDSDIIKDGRLSLGVTKTWDQLYSQVTMTAGKGRTYYKGYIFNQNGSLSPSSDIIPNALFDTQGRLGYMLPLNQKIIITPFTTLGYHRWFRHIGSVQAPYGFMVNGYDEAYQNYFYAAGLIGQWNPIRSLVLTAEGSWGRTFKSSLSTWFPYSPDDTTMSYYTVWHLKAKPIYNVTLAADYDLGKNWHLIAKIDETRFKYGKSPANKLGGYEPDSTSRLISTSLGIGYSF
jgi:hypothetical protein